MVYYRVVEEENRVEIFYDKKPEYNVEAFLNVMGFKWDTKMKCMVAKNNAFTVDVAKDVADVEGVPNAIIEKRKKAIENAEKKRREKHEQKIEAAKAIIAAEREEKVKLKKSLSTAEPLKYKDKDSLVSINRSKICDIEFTKLVTDESEIFFDIREVYNDGGSGEGITLSEDELRAIINAVNWDGTCVDTDKLGASRKNTILFENEIFRIRYLGLKKKKDNYYIDFEATNKSAYRLRVIADIIDICGCKFEISTTIADDIRIREKQSNYIKVSENVLHKNGINKLWQYSLLEVKFSYSYAISEDSISSLYNDIHETDSIKIAPDFE